MILSHVLQIYGGNCDDLFHSILDQDIDCDHYYIVL